MTDPHVQIKKIWNNMDEQTALVLALQLIALFSIAGALLLYLLCKIRNNSSLESGENMVCGGKPILVTSCDNALGLQIAMHFANRGFRVFAGLKEGASSGSPHDSASARVIRAWQKHRESLSVPLQGSLIALPLDVTREDISHEAVDIIRAHLPAGEDGIWAVINTSGISYRGRFDQQDVTYWDAMLKTNVIGVLRTARIFQSLLRKTSGRIINIGSTNGEESGLVAYTATKYAIQGASNALRQEFSPLGIKVITIDPRGILPELMYSMPKIRSKEDNEVALNISGVLDYQPLILTSKALEIIDVAVSSAEPKQTYTLMQRPYWCKPLRLIHV
ncbi:D-beta-hydroxybutyrate dehydrogenase, mitochondrial-like isoform X2 [Photinus pyralis]|uniref:D-beta-hydroxybutyrate dehydrogenase, mitochondrial-like isoform X2 n=1 Tax=Photinus pyralis TaxID=7054 RepID=UPI0012671BF6|nr:D-beta-hydroxybutyrate dehydrogenase, mitochondrial-like isoform X2 [Photinus pyralis]XP_031351761.1 D-beta-hydroxybutyrate dehydrogenase, mitochondrial-like isoform X2 [Photinus pyralis]